MRIHLANPLEDPRWNHFVAHHPNASVFHDRSWLKSLALTYGFQPIALTSTPEGLPLQNALVMCSVASSITGARLVSLPFSDHCDPLVNTSDELECFTQWLQAECNEKHYRYFELRPKTSLTYKGGPLTTGAMYHLHLLDLSPSLETLFRRLHKDSMQRRIRRAEKAGLAYEAGRSEQLLNEFYSLNIQTRRRHHVVPQPRAWFRNLITSFDDKLLIRVARKEQVPVAAMLTLRQGSTVTYKYGCSDERFHQLGAMPYLFWKLIEESHTAGGTLLDLGRSDLDQAGLIAFKDHLGATKVPLQYLRYERGEAGSPANYLDAFRNLLPLMPDALMPVLGRILYRHMG